MKRRIFVATLLTLVVGSVVLASVLGAIHPAASGRVYSVSRFLEGGKAFQMQRGEVALVRGTMTCNGSPTCLISGPTVDSPGGIGLMVYLGSETGVEATLRGLPLLGALLPPTSAHPLTGRAATYRVVFVGCPGAPSCPNGMTQWRLRDGGAP